MLTENLSGPSTLIVGVGSAHGDDQFGWRVAQRLKAELNRPRVQVRTALSPCDLFDWLDGVDQLILCDACQNLGTPGTVHAWRWPAAELSLEPSLGGHDLSLVTAVAMAEQLGRLPKDVLIVSVESTQHKPATEISPEIAAAVPSAVALILGVLHHARDFARQDVA
jgi:hydrogenase maturation protease